MPMSRLVSAALAFIVVCTPALAKDFTLNFDGIPPANTPAESGSNGLSEVLGYYNGDPGPAPVFPRAGNRLFDVTLSAGALAINSREAGGPGNFATAHSDGSAVGTVEADTFRLDLNTGVSLSALGFWYDRLSGTKPTFQLFSNGESVFTDTLDDTCISPPGDDGYCGWTQYLVGNDVLSDLAANGRLVNGIEFSTDSNSAVFDDMALSTTTGNQPVPEPSSIALAALGLVLVVSRTRRRRIA